MFPLNKLTADHFRPHMNQTFSIDLADQKLPVELIEVTENQGRQLEPHHPAPFSVIFRGPKELYLPQMIYPIEHPELGRLDIFIVPIMPDQQGALFQAVFQPNPDWRPE